MSRFHVTVELSERELNLTIIAMSASQVPLDIQKDTFELVERLRDIRDEAIAKARLNEAT